MATRLTILWLVAVAALVWTVLAEVAVAALAAPNSRELHHQIVRGLKGKWTTMWEFPIQQEFASRCHLTASPDATPSGEDSMFINDLSSYGFALAKINGSIYWTNNNAHDNKGAGSSSSSSSQAGGDGSVVAFGERPTDDTLVWSITRPDHSTSDSVTVFELPHGEAAKSKAAASNGNDDTFITPDYYFPLLDTQLLSQFETFDGQYYPNANAKKLAPSASASSVLNLPNNAMIRAGLQRATEAMRRFGGEKAFVPSSHKAADGDDDELFVAPSYGYVLCSSESAEVPTTAHRTEDGEYFTRTRRVVEKQKQSSSSSSPSKSVYLTRTTAYKGVIFALAVGADVLLSAEDAAKKFCSAADTFTTTPTRTTTPLTITTVGAASDIVSGASHTLAEGGLRVNNGDGAGTKKKTASTLYWDFDSLVFEFGLLPHEKTTNEAKRKAIEHKFSEEYLATLNDAEREVLANYTARQNAALLEASEAFAQHPLMTDLLLSSNDDEKKAARETKKDDTAATHSSVLHHRITLRRIHRPEDFSTTQTISHYIDAYWRMALVALGFILFRFYVGYRYSSKKQRSVRQTLSTEETKMLAKAGRAPNAAK